MRENRDLVDGVIEKSTLKKPRWNTEYTKTWRKECCPNFVYTRIASTYVPGKYRAQGGDCSDCWPVRYARIKVTMRHETIYVIR